MANSTRKKKLCGVSTPVQAADNDTVIVLNNAGPNELEDAFYEVIMARNSVVLQEDVFEAFQAAMRRVY